jgi:hypothetical protein
MFTALCYSSESFRGCTPSVPKKADSDLDTWIWAAKYGFKEMEKVLQKWQEDNIYEELALNVGLQNFLKKGVPVGVLGGFVCEMAADYCDAYAETWGSQRRFRREGVACVDCGSVRPGVHRNGTLVTTVAKGHDSNA